MMRAILFSGAACAALLSGCGAIPDDRPPDVRPHASVSTKAPACFSSLDQAQVRYRAAPNRDDGGGCRILDAVMLTDTPVPVTAMGPMTCPLAAQFSAWVRHAAIPAAREILGSPLVRIESMGTYSCRNINGAASGKRSQHATANAIDVAAFVLADGRRVSVLAGWNGKKAEQKFLRALHASACKRFGTVLGPEYNSLHHDHLHFDMSGDGFCR